MTSNDIEANMQKRQKQAFDRAVQALANDGLAPGAIVETVHHFTGAPTGEIYCVVRVGDPGFYGYDRSLYLYGHKLRRDGSYGDHVHSIAGFDRVRIRRPAPSA